jgi:hypothetical protein
MCFCVCRQLPYFDTVSQQDEKINKNGIFYIFYLFLWGQRSPSFPWLTFLVLGDSLAYFLALKIERVGSSRTSVNIYHTLYDATFQKTEGLLLPSHWYCSRILGTVVHLSSSTVTARSKAWIVFAHWNSGIVGSKPAWVYGCLSAFILCLCCPVCRRRPCDGLIPRPRNPAEYV